MTATAHLRKGWCPGALRPMQSGDGLLLRVRPKAGSFSIAALEAIADAASRFGSGEIDLTNRGNLQLRGVSEETYPEALAALDAAGLIDAEVGAEAVRNVVVDPLSGLDPARADIRKHAAELEHVLVQDRRFWSLPGKFGFSFSGSSQPRVGGRTADIMIAVAGRSEFAIFLDGDMAAAAPVSASEIVDAAMRLAAVFLLLRRDDQSVARMRDAVVRHGSATIFSAAGLQSAPVAAAEDELRCNFCLSDRSHIRAAYSRQVSACPSDVSSPANSRPCAGRGFAPRYRRSSIPAPSACSSFRSANPKRRRHYWRRPRSCTSSPKRAIRASRWMSVPAHRRAGMPAPKRDATRSTLSMPCRKVSPPFRLSISPAARRDARAEAPPH